MSETKKQSSLYRAGAQEASVRPVRRKPLNVLEYTPSGPTESWIAIPGTVNIFFATKGSSLLEQVRAVVNDPAADTTAVKSELERIGRSPQPSEAERVEMLRNAPVIVEVRHGGVTLASDMVPLGNGDVYAVTCPYNGGRFASEGFTLIERYQDGTSVEVDGFVLSYSPTLTAAEKAALESVSEDQLELNVAKGFCSDNGTAQTAWVVTMVVTGAVTMVGVGCLSRASNPVSEERIQELGPAATARELLAMRRDLLENVESNIQ